jgi:hypothetical protein
MMLGYPAGIVFVGIRSPVLLKVNVCELRSRVKASFPRLDLTLICNIHPIISIYLYFNEYIKHVVSLYFPNEAVLIAELVL